MRRGSLRLRLTLALLGAAGLGGLAALSYERLAWPEWAPISAETGAVSVLLVVLASAGVAAGALLRPLRRMLRSLETEMLNYRDGDFSVTIAPPAVHELKELGQLHNALGRALRDQRQHLAQRELLLDTVIQHTPVALLLVDGHGHIAFANLAARQLLGEGRSLQGTDFEQMLDRTPASLREAVDQAEDTFFTATIEGADETFHLLQRGFQLQGRPHRLYLFRRMTRELSRQEVATWKRVIRVVSHELNNSLAPISSLSHSAGELLKRGQHGEAGDVLDSIGHRVRHLHAFLDSYADLAKLPAPRLTTVAWAPFLAALARHARFRCVGEAVPEHGWFDAAQVEQALINVLKNASESGGPAEDVTVGVVAGAQADRIEVCDRGDGMSDAVLAQALLPFYSTKHSGTGLGLALVREIAEAHGGRVALANREGGGLRVTLTLPHRVQPVER